MGQEKILWNLYEEKEEKMKVLIILITFLVDYITYKLLYKESKPGTVLMIILLTIAGAILVFSGEFE
jgi:hypothetical protein